MPAVEARADFSGILCSLIVEEYMGPCLYRGIQSLQWDLREVSEAG